MQNYSGLFSPLSEQHLIVSHEKVSDCFALRITYVSGFQVRGGKFRGMDPQLLSDCAMILQNYELMNA